MVLLGLLSYVVAAAILHKLDQLELRRAAVVPLCGQDGLFKYEVQVKTGWSHGAGESQGSRRRTHTSRPAVLKGLNDFCW